MILRGAKRSSIKANLKPRRSWIRSALAVLVTAMPIATIWAAESRGAADRLRLPLLFEERKDGDYRFIARGPGYGVAVAGDRVALTTLSNNERWLMRFVDSDPSSSPQGGTVAQGRVHRFTGNDPRLWTRSLATYSRVLVRRIYPGVDVALYGNQRRLEYDFKVAPGADASRIRLLFEGRSKPRLAPNGDLLLGTGDSAIRHLKPVAYQTAAQGRSSVEARYVIDQDGHVRFSLGDYDRRLPLVIDPIVTASSFLGGTGAEEGRAVLVDEAGMIYLTGSTVSDDFALTDPLQGTRRGNRDAFVTKIDPNGFQIVFSTFLGGTFDDVGTVLARDPSGNIYVAGETFSSNFPLTLEPTQAFRRGAREIFLLRLSGDGSELRFSTFWGGSSDDTPAALMVGSDGAMCLAGQTSSFNFPVTGDALQAQPNGDSDLFISFFSPFGNSLFSTLLGGSGRDTLHDGVRQGDLITLAGETRSEDFPLEAPFQDTLQGPQDVLFVQFDRAELKVTRASFFGGTGTDSAKAIRIGAFGQIFLAGDTDSVDFPVIDAIQPKNAGGLDIFLTRMNPGTGAPVFSTYLGGDGDDELGGFTLDGANVALLGGATRSENFPTVEPDQATNGGGWDGFVAKIDAARATMTAGTYHGGTEDDRIVGVDVDPNGRIVVVGETSSSDFPVTGNAFQVDSGGASDAFVSIISDVVRLNFAQFGDGGDGPTLASRIELLNANPALPANVRIDLRGSGGQPMTVDLNGETVDGRLEATIPSGGNLRLQTDGVGELQTGAVQVASDVAIAGFVFFDAGAIGVTGVASSPRLRTLLSPVEIGNGVNTALALMGLGIAQDLNLTLRDAAGVTMGRATFGLGAFEQRALFVTEIDWDRQVDFSEFRGNLSAEGSADFSATAIQTRPGLFIVIPVAAR